MRALARNMRWLLVAVAFVGYVQRIESAERDYYPPPTAEASVDGAPRPLNGQPADARPFDQAPAQPVRSRYETVHPDAVSSAVAAEPPTVQPNQPAPLAEAPGGLPLAPPSEGAKSGPRTREMPALATAGASLGIVLGLFMLVVWVARRGGPRDATLLPADAVEILGRAPFVGRQHVHLVRCGPKILLVCASPTSVTTLTEITDPAEVEKLLATCQSDGAAASPFRQVMEQFGSVPRDRRYFARHESAELDFAHLEARHSGAAEPVT